MTRFACIFSTFAAGAVFGAILVAANVHAEDLTFPAQLRAHFAAAVSPSGNAIVIQADEQGRVICSPLVP
jgi:hypothetical protein